MVTVQHEYKLMTELHQSECFSRLTERETINWKHVIFTYFWFYALFSLG